MNCAVCDWTPSTATDHTVGTSCPEVNSVVRQQDPVLLDNVLDGAREEYAAANPSSRARHEAALASMPGGEHPHGSSPRTVPAGVRVRRGRGAHVARRRDYTDFLGEFTAGLYGHSHPVILDAIRRTLDHGISFGGHDALEARLAAPMVDRFASVDLVRFTSSGTEANLMALATATASTGRRKVVVFDYAYHGSLRCPSAPSAAAAT